MAACSTFGLIQPDNARGSVLALDAASGAERWRADLGQTTVLGPIESLWVDLRVFVVVPGFGGDIVALERR
jgi:outer membrane protein assembly factor BamB